jgi:general secretion pathway protein G
VKAPRRGERGYTFFELIACAGILMVLASAALPLAKVSQTRRKELELRRALREMRTAIDRYQEAVVQGQIGGTDVKVGSEGYPPTLEVLVDGVSQVGRVDHKLKFLRRIPTDPFTGKAEWGLRCYQDDADETSWCGQNVYDVRSLAPGKALDGSEYEEW